MRFQVHYIEASPRIASVIGQASQNLKVIEFNAEDRLGETPPPAVLR
jgi:hypothetical protein